MNSRLKSCLLAVSAGVLALAFRGCMTVGPGYVAPVLELPSDWHSPYARDAVETPPAQARYWEAFDDPVLDDLIQRVSQNNRNLQTALAAVDEARAFLGISEASRWPSVSQNASATYNRSSRNTQPLDLPNRDREDTTFSLGPSATWEIDLFGRVRRSVESAEAALAATEADFADLLIVLYAETAEAYFAYRALEQRLAFAEANVALQEGTLELTRTRVQAGLVPELDRAQAELNLNRSRALLPLLREGRDNVFHALAVLTGVYPWDLAPLLAAPAVNPLVPVVATTTTPTDTLRQRPDVRAAERALAAQTARIGVATADLYPRFFLSGSISLSAFDAGKLCEGDSRGFSIGPGMNWRVFEAGRLRDLVRVEEARTAQALAQYEQAVLTAVREVEDALSGLANERQRNADLTRAVSAAEESVQLAQDLYRTGLVEFDTVLEVQTALLFLQDDLASSNGAVRQNIVRFYRSIGGGTGVTSKNRIIANETLAVKTDQNH